MRHSQSKFLGRLADLVSRHAYVVLGMWIIVAAGLNVATPQLEQVCLEKSGPLIPESAPSLVTLKKIGTQFGESQASALGYLVLEDNRGFNDADRAYYDDMVAKLRANHSEIESVQDLLPDPATTHIAASQDGKAVYAIVRFHGGLGAAPQREGQQFVHESIDHTPKPGGLSVYLTGPAPTIGDEIAAQEHSVTLITAATIGMIVVLLLYRLPSIQHNPRAVAQRRPGTGRFTPHRRTVGIAHQPRRIDLLGDAPRGDSSRGGHGLWGIPPQRLPPRASTRDVDSPVDCGFRQPTYRASSWPPALLWPRVARLCQRLRSVCFEPPDCRAR